jgi:SAM-dependent methyltransferase
LLGDQAVEQEEAATFLRSVQGPPAWTADAVEWRNQELILRGWALPSDAPGFTIDGRPFDSIDIGIDRPDVGRLFWFLPDARRSGFECRTKLPEDCRDSGLVAFDYVDGRTGRPFSDAHTYFHPGPTAAYPELPDGARRRRVHGAEDENAFVLEGFSAFVKLQRVLERTVGRSYDDFTAMLDWGCGCGRFARYFAPLHPSAYVGVDVDADNAAWCDAQLPFGRFFGIPFHPPTPLDAGSFDLLVGISVLTHLGEADQDEWLRELSRIAAPGAILLLTTHGGASIARSGASARQVLAWRESGFLDVGRSADLDDVLTTDERDYYRNVLHTPEYVRRSWARWFEVVDVVAGTIGNHQDVVVLRRPAAPPKPLPSLG